MSEMCIRDSCTIGETKTGDLTGFYGYDIYYNKTNYELAYTIERIDGELVVVVMAGTVSYTHLCKKEMQIYFVMRTLHVKEIRSVCRKLMPAKLKKMIKKRAKRFFA